VKWSDRFFERPSELKNLVSFAEANAIARISSTTRTLQGIREVGHVRVRFVPTSVYCYTLGANIIGNFGRRAATSADAPSAP
jgi:hypothetical protein